MNKLIKNIIIFTSSILFLTSCERLVHTKYELEVVFDNKISTIVNVEVLTNIERNNTFIDIHKKDSLYFINEQMFDSGFFGGNEINEEYMVVFKDYFIFNLIDTAKIEYSSCTSTERSILDRKLNTNFITHSLYSGKNYCTLTIDSTLLPIFKKDYGMLEQFKEYYE